MSVDTLYAEHKKTSLYFGTALVAFLLSFVAYDSAKFTNNLFYVGIALPGLCLLLKRRGAGVFTPALGCLWLAFLAWFLVPGLYSGDFQFYRHIAYVSLFVFIVAGLTNVDFFSSGRFVRGQFWMICLYIFASSIHSWVTGQFVVGERVGILAGRLDNVIYASVWMFCALALALPAWVSQKRWIEGPCAIALAMFAAAFVVQTRTALVGAAFLFGLWALYLVYRFPLRGSIALVAVGLLGAALLWLAKDQQWVQLLFVRGDSYRVELFEIMTGEWRNCGLLLGCGVDFHTTKTLTGGIPIQHPHNIFIAMGLYTGAISLMLFVAVLALTLWHAWRLRDAWGTYLACALVMLNFDGSKLVGNPDELWLLVLLPSAMVLGRVVKNRASATPAPLA
jgi:hypothetical protein